MPQQDLGDIWVLRADLLWARALLGFAAFGAREEPRPDVHYFLFDRYFRLSELQARRGALQRSQLLRERALWHLERSGQDDPPPAAAAALPAVRRPSFTWAVAGRPKPPEPPNAA